MVMGYIIVTRRHYARPVLQIIQGLHVSIRNPLMAEGTVLAAIEGAFYEAYPYVWLGEEEISSSEGEGDDATESAVTTISKKQRLVELKQLFDEGLISESEYQKARESVLDIEPKT